MTMATRSSNTLFGGEMGWDTSDWTASDDRVRGGKSHSYLKITDDESVIFCGHLDIDTLGGAGFASQRTADNDLHWDLSGCDAIQLTIDAAKSDDKVYTFILKDEILPPNPKNGREQSTTSWEYEFRPQDGVAHSDNPDLVSVYIPWQKLMPTYRGKAVSPGHLIKAGNIRRISIMMRSFFGSQKGDFSLCLHSITTVGGETNVETCTQGKVVRDPNASEVEHSAVGRPKTSIWTRVLSLCNKL